MKAFNGGLLAAVLLTGMAAEYFKPCVGAAEQCDPWMGKVVSVQGDVHSRKKGESRWTSAKRDDVLCPGDMIRVQERARAAVLLPNGALLRLDQGTMLTFAGREKEKTSLLDLIKGALHFFSQEPRTLKIATPFVNGSVEGTECFMRVEEDQTFLSVFRGRVLASNEAGSLTVLSGQSAVAATGKTPRPQVVIRPRDAVTWALYYPPVIAYRPVDFPAEDAAEWTARARRSIEFYWKGDLSKAFTSLGEIPEGITDPRYFLYRAGLFLTVGRVQEADADIKRAMKLAPLHSDAFSLQAMIAVVRNRRDEALELARRAVDLNPVSATARIALSYAQQAASEVKPALESLREAVNLDPENALAWSRLAELWLSVGHLDRALEAAEKGASLNPGLARTQTVLGFAFLMQIRIGDAKKAFEKAIQLDQANPLPRLGLGLAKIRVSDLKEGRREIEIAAILDPNNALIRSYLGKAYFEEKRDGLAMDQYAAAKELDPLDPTAYFYDAIRKQSVNRPVEALKDLQKSIELNRNRAVYRSSLLLDEDLAARSASLGGIYRDLGFEQLALAEGWKSVNVDPTNYSAHRFLADTYSALPRHEIARVSEVLQTQLLQPININPVQPRLAESNLLLLEGAGPAAPAFNEFNPLFLRNRAALQAHGLIGGNDTFADELVHSAVWGRTSYSLGQFHYETEGFRENNDLRQDIYNVFSQISISPKTSVLAEWWSGKRKEGDLPLRFDQDDEERFSPNRRKEKENEFVRFGFRHSFSPRSDFIAHFSYLDGEEHVRDGTQFTDFRIGVEEQGYFTEGQQLFRSELFRLATGIGYYSAEQDEAFRLSLITPPTLLDESFTTAGIRHTNIYTYANVFYPKNFIWTFGGSGDFYDDEVSDIAQFNPKLGVIWTPLPGTTVRAAAFRTLKRTLVSNQTIEPTQVGGFNQFFDDVNGARTWRYGIGIDRRFFPSGYGGLEYSERALKVPYEDMTRGGAIAETKWDEKLMRAYFYWTPRNWAALGLEYLFEGFDRSPEMTGEEEILELDTHRFPFTLGLFHPSGLSGYMRATYLNQDGEFGNSTDGFFRGDDQFWVFDASISFRFPERRGFLSLGAKNIFDEAFKFQDTDLANQRVYPERYLFGKVTFVF